MCAFTSKSANHLEKNDGPRFAHACSRSTSAGGVRMCPSAASTLSTGRKYQAEAEKNMRKNMRKNMSTAGFCCCLLPKHASQAYCLMLMNVVVATAQLLTTAQAMLKMKSACFEKASQEIGVPRGKKSERYRSTPRYRSSDRSK